MADLYAPPKADVRDVEPPTPGFRVRSAWLYTGLTLIFFAMGLRIFDALAAALSPAVALVSLIVTALVSASPLHVLIRKRSAAAPVWWNIVASTISAAMLAAFFLGEGEALAATYMPLLAMSAIIAAACWLVEWRGRVLVYSTMNSFVIVPRQ